MQIGIFTKVFPRTSLELTLDAVKATGLHCVQFNMESAGLPVMPDVIADDEAARIHEETDRRGITIGSVSWWRRSMRSTVCRSSTGNRSRASRRRSPTV